MGRGYPLAVYNSTGGGGLLRGQLGGTFWRACHYHNGSGDTVHRWHVAMHVQSSRKQARADNCLPPPGQWHGGAVPSLGLCAAPKEEAGVSAAEAAYGHSLVLPSQLQPPPRAPQPPREDVVIPSTVKPAREAEKQREVGVQEASHVYVRVGAVTGPASLSINKDVFSFILS